MVEFCFAQRQFVSLELRLILEEFNVSCVSFYGLWKGLQRALEPGRIRSDGYHGEHRRREGRLEGLCLFWAADRLARLMRRERARRRLRRLLRRRRHSEIL